VIKRRPTLNILSSGTQGPCSFLPPMVQDAQEFRGGHP
jgi:hypothetical protein